MDTNNNRGSGTKNLSDQNDSVRPYKWRKLRTFGMFAVFLCIGMATTIHGPVAVNLQELLSMDTRQISISFALTQAGFVVAAILCGALFSRLDSELQFLVCSVFLGVALAAAPWASNVYGFTAASVVVGFGRGYMDTGGVAQMLLMWDGERAKEPLFQAIHLTWTCGASLAPVLVKPFLVETRSGTGGCMAGNVSAAAIGNEFAAEMTKQSAPLNLSAEVSANASSVRNLSEAAEEFESGDCVDVTVIRYAYLLVASIILFVALFYVALYCLLGHHLGPQESRAKQQTSATQHSHESRAYRFGFYALTAVFCLFLSTLDVIGTSYLSLFVVNLAGWSVQDGATLTTVFWSCGAGVRVVSIPLSYVISPRLMLAASLTFICVGSVMLVFIRALGDVLIYVAVALAGIGMSNAFPNTMLWLSSLLPCPSTLSSIGFTFLHAGMVTCYLLFGMLGRHYGYIVYVYMAVASGCVLLFLFLVMNIYARAGAVKQHQDKSELELEVKVENKCEVFVTAL